MSKKITASQAWDLEYYWEEKEDFRRPSAYLEVRDVLKDKYQSLYDGERMIKQGQMIIEATLAKIMEDSDDEED